jgi:hypothetical protein
MFSGGLITLIVGLARFDPALRHKCFLLKPRRTSDLKWNYLTILGVQVVVEMGNGGGLELWCSSADHIETVANVLKRVASGCLVSNAV